MRAIKNKYEASVIIPTYNRSGLLNYSLQSLSRQTIDKNRFEVVIADDGSSDDTMAVVRKYKDLINIKYVYQEDKGYCPGSARNLGINVAEGQICIFVDSGVLLNSNCIEAHIKFYAEATGPVAAIGYVYGFDRTGDSEKKLKALVDPEDAAGSIQILSGNETFSDVRDDHYVNYDFQIHHLPAPWYYYWTCHVSATRAGLWEAGLFDEGFDGKWGVEDTELAFRLCQNGTKIHLLRTAEALHYPHEKDKEGRRSEGYQNCIYFNSKFNTMETKIYLDNYLNRLEFVDINKLIIEMSRVGEKANAAFDYETGKLISGTAL